MKSVDLGGKHSSGILWSQSVQSDVTEKRKWDEKKWDEKKWDEKKWEDEGDVNNWKNELF